MTRILHLSDTHFGTERPQVVDALIALAHTLSPQLIVVSGDITQRATRAQFAAARRFLEALPPCPRLLLPGNHDIPLLALWQRALSPYARYRAGLGVDALAPMLSLPGVHAIAVKTTRRRRHIDGEVSPAQIEAVAATLRALPAADLKLVVTHQPLWVDRADDQHNRCRGADAALAAWVAARAHPLAVCCAPAAGACGLGDQCGYGGFQTRASGRAQLGESDRVEPRAGRAPLPLDALRLRRRRRAVSAA